LQVSAYAAITITTTPFAGVLTDFTGLGDQALPYLDANGRTVSASGFTITQIDSGSGLYYVNSGQLTFSGLAAGTTQIGFSFGDVSNNFGFLDSTRYIASISLDNGNSLSVGSGVTDVFVGFTDTTPFTSATLTMAVTPGWSGYVADFRTTGDSRSPVPEPASLGLLAVALPLFGVAALRLKKRGSVNRAE
jgi:hypothetical protein